MMEAGMISAVISAIVLLAVIVLYIVMQQIHKLVNSAMSEMKDKVESLETEIENLGGPAAPPKRSRDDQR